MCLLTFQLVKKYSPIIFKGSSARTRLECAYIVLHSLSMSSSVYIHVRAIVCVCVISMFIFADMFVFVCFSFVLFCLFFGTIVLTNKDFWCFD